MGNTIWFQYTSSHLDRHHDPERKLPAYLGGSHVPASNTSFHLVANMLRVEIISSFFGGKHVSRPKHISPP
ncbi:MAG: hypothetical protein LBH04_10540 [Tannerellaceae bacterium]|nr:hypothetical protein [Tannerellaceae bacterium]